MMEKDDYVGRILTGRITSGVIRINDRVHGLRDTDSGVIKIEEGKVCDHIGYTNCIYYKKKDYYYFLIVKYMYTFIRL